MNHRQWKKRFKKIHGRNPSIMEDKKKAAKCIKSFMPEITESLYRATSSVKNIFLEFGELLFKSLSVMSARLSEAFGEIAEAYKEEQDGRA